MAELFSLLKHLKPYKSYVIASILCQIGYAIFTLVSIPLIIPFFQVLFNEKPKELTKPESVIEGANWLEFYFNQLIASYSREDALLGICIAIVVLFFFKNLFRYLALYTMNPVRNGIVKDLRNDLFQQLLIIPLHELKTRKKGDIISRITMDAQEVEWSILQVLEAFIKSPLIIIGSVIFMIFISPKLTLFVFVLMIFTIFIIGAVSKSLRKDSKKLQENLSSITSHVDESISGMSNIRSYNRQSFWENEFNQKNKSYFTKIVSVLRKKDLASPLSEFLGIAVVSLLLYYGSYQVFQGNFSPETFFAFIFAFYQIIEPSKSFSSAYYNYKKGLAAYDRIKEFNFDAMHKLDHSQSTKSFHFNNNIVFNQVNFIYPNKKDLAIKNISFTVEKGSTVALVGASGSGKSTILSLLLKFYSIDTGSILIDGNNFNEISTSEWRENIAFVTQDAFLFHGSLKDNIIFGREKISDSKITEAMKNANLAAMISDLGMNVGQSGQALSGGERQRVSIARALANDPEILLLDEPTSSLDPKAEKEVSEAIHKCMSGRTAIIVAHKFSTIKNADKIIVLDKGEIVEQGTHEELINNNGHYYKYLSLQKDF